MKNRNDHRYSTRLSSLVLISAFIIAIAAVAVPFYSARSSSLPARGSSQASLPSGAPAPMTSNSILARSPSSFQPVLRVTEPLPEGIATYLASDCSTPKTDFSLGEAVCAKATGVPISLFPWHVAWLDSAGLIQQLDVASTDDTTQYHFTPTSIGTWRVNLLRSNGAVRQTATFTVHDTAHVTADVLVQKIVRDGDASVPTGGSIAFLLIVANAGPDTAQNVHLIDSVPSGATLVSFTQQTGPACAPAAANDCTIASLANGERSEFTAVYQVGGSAGTVLTTATVSSPTPDSDNSNNTSTAQFEITAGGSPSECSLVCPTSISFDQDPGTGSHVIHSADFPSPVTTGTCGSVSMTAAPDPQTNDYLFPIGTSVITASTESGETCTFTVTINDTESPTINCPANIARFESSPGSGSATVTFNVTSADNSGSAPVSCDHNSGDSFSGTTTVHCTATDSGNNSASCDFTVTITPDSGCRVTVPAPIVATADANACGTHVSFATPTGNAQCVAPISCDHASGSFFAVGETLVTCSDTTGGNSTFTVNVEDHTPPTPTLATLPTITHDCSASAGVPTTIQTPSGPKVVFEAPTATDNCGLISGATADPVTYQVPGTYVVHWVYDDGHGNTTSQNQTINVTTDTSPPVPDVALLPPLTGECSATVTTVPTATDACTGTVAGTTGDPLTYTTQGDFTITWHYDDGNGHVSTQTQQVHVHDVTPPTISPAPPDVDRSTGPGNTTCTVLVTDAELGTPPTATDNCSVTVTRSGVPAGNQFPLGTTNVVYTATDAGGTTRSVTQHVTVHDTTPPTITVDGANPLYVECHTTFVDPGATAHDNCGNFAATASGVVDANTVGTYTINYNATDAAGNPAAQVSRTVIVQDTLDPTITLNGQTPSMWPPNHDYHTFGVADFVTSASDQCDTSITVGSVVITKVTSDEAENGNGSGNTLKDIVIASNCKSVQLRSEREGGGNGRVYTIYFKVTDASGHFATATAKVVVPHNPGETAVDSGPHYTVTSNCGP